MKKENIKAIIEDSLKKVKKTINSARNFHPVYGKPYFDIPDATGKISKKEQ